MSTQIPREHLSRIVDITRLKAFVLKELPPSSIVRQLILSKPNKLEASDFIATVPDLLTLLDLELEK